MTSELKEICKHFEESAASDIGCIFYLISCIENEVLQHDLREAFSVFVSMPIKPSIPIAELEALLTDDTSKLQPKAESISDGRVGLRAAKFIHEDALQALLEKYK